MRSVAVLIAPLLTLLLYSGPALAGQHSSHVIIVGNGVSHSVFVPPHSRVVIVQRPFAQQPFIVERPFVPRSLIVERPFFVRRVFVDREVVIVRRSFVPPPVIVERGFVPQSQLFRFDSFGGPP